MFNTGNCASVPLVANIDGNGNNNGWGAEGSWLWFIIVIFAIFGWGGFGNGFGGNGMNGGVGSEIQRGFDNQAVVSKLDGISNGLCDGFYAMNNSMLTGFNGINTNIMQTGYGIQQAINADTVANMQNTNKELLRALKDEYGEEGGRRYYDEYRYANGKFAPKGRGIRRGYTDPPYYHMPVNYNDMEYMRDMDKDRGKMYYSEPIAPHVSESNYDRAKRHYTETKEMHKNNTPEDKEHKMKALDDYIKELGGDITQLIGDMTAEERNLMRTKLSTLVSKL